MQRKAMTTKSTQFAIRPRRKYRVNGQTEVMHVVLQQPASGCATLSSICTRPNTADVSASVSQILAMQLEHLA